MGNGNNFGLDFVAKGKKQSGTRTPKGFDLNFQRIGEKEKFKFERTGLKKKEFVGIFDVVSPTDEILAQGRQTVPTSAREAALSAQRTARAELNRPNVPKGSTLSFSVQNVRSKQFADLDRILDERKKNMSVRGTLRGL